eukprot:935570-Prymnesium_polylepis.2
MAWNLRCGDGPLCWNACRDAGVNCERARRAPQMRCVRRLKRGCVITRSRRSDATMTRPRPRGWVNY